jgi:hypothetical protein
LVPSDGVFGRCDVAVLRGCHTFNVCLFCFLHFSFPQGDNTALHWAAMRGHVEVVRALLAAGSDREAVNRQGATALDLCQPVWSHSWRFTRQLLAGAA